MVNVLSGIGSVYYRLTLFIYIMGEIFMKGLIFLCAMLLATHGYAQSSGSDVVEAGDEATEVQTTSTVQPIQPVPSNERVEKIEVTGSRIKRIDVEGPSPVLTLDREFLDRSGYNSVADVLRDTTVSSFGVEREYSDESNSVGAGTIGLRGLGADRTLVLLDGRRLPKIDGGNSVDLNLIPFQAIERVEILKDGASAIYGSDALAGVINFITKKDFDGANVSTRYSVPELAGGGRRQEIGATVGKRFSKGNVLAVYQYRNNERIMDSDRPWSTGARSDYGSPASYRPYTDSGKWKAASSCPKGQKREESDGSSFCTFDYSVYTSGLPDTEQHSAMVKGDYDINGRLNAFATTTYTHRQIRWQWAPSADNFTDSTSVGGKNYVIPVQAANKLGGSVSSPVELQYRTLQELGPRASRDTTDAYGAVVGVRGELMDTWEWETSANYGVSRLNNLRHAGYGNKRILYDGILSGKVNPWAPNDQKSAFSEAHHVGDQLIQSNVTSTQFVTSGNLAEFGSASLNMATGVSSTWESYSVKVDDVTAAGDLFGGIGESGRGDRNYQSFFSEFGLNFGQFEVITAGRFDNYSDFGSTVNPKLSMRYSPFQFLMLRGSAGTGFRAPSLDELYSSNGYLYPWFVDPQACANLKGTFCQERQYQVFTGGNPDLKEETSFSYNLGAMIQPTRSFSIGIDFWETRVKNAVGLDYNDLMFAENQLGTAAIEAQGIQINRTGGVISNVVAPNLNLAQQQSKGLEVVMSYTMRFGALSVRPQIDHSHLLENKEEVFPGLGFRNKLGERGRPDWRNTASVSFGLFNHGLRLMARTIAGQYKMAHLSNPNYSGRIATYTEYDLHYDYADLFDGQFSFGVKNLLASNRPLDDSAGFQNRFNTQLYDQIGRLFYMGYGYNF